ncbi:MAG: ABC transporter substrate-binding protein [Planctomycetes bacterium]|nr:ABC transporter substrate-binding protein [Planctomycetota bacterium]
MRRALETCILITCVVSGCAREESSASPRRSRTGPAKRIIALAPNAAEIICGLGACDALVGVSRFCDYPPEIDHLPKIGGLRDPDLEVVLSLDPDLFIFRGNSPALEQLCRDHDIHIYDDPTETLGDIYRTVAELGRLVGREVEAERMIADVQTTLAEIVSAVADQPRVRVLFVVWRSADTLTNVMTTGRDTFLNELIDIAGGRNVFGTMDVRYPTVSLEEIIAAAPEVIVDVTGGQELSPVQKASLLAQWRKLGPIPAVENGRIHFVTDSYITIPSQRVTLAARLLLAMLHPEIAASD